MESVSVVPRSTRVSKGRKSSGWVIFPFITTNSAIFHACFSSCFILIFYFLSRYLNHSYSSYLLAFPTMPSFSNICLLFRNVQFNNFQTYRLQFHRNGICENCSNYNNNTRNSTIKFLTTIQRLVNKNKR